MKKIISLALLFAGIATSAYAYIYDTWLPLPGKSIADVNLQRETLFTAYAFAHRIAAPDCTAFSIVDTAVSKAKVDNKWQEIWTIKACQRTATVPMNFEVKNGGNIYGIDPMGVRVYNK